jgi:hypothetical protein
MNRPAIESGQVRWIHTGMRSLTAEASKEDGADYATLWRPRQAIPCRNGHLYIHPTALCPVACEHCMYGSDLTKTGKVSLTDDDVRELIGLLDDLVPTKLTISGGGEPFLRFQHCLNLISKTPADDMEIITAGNWATTRARSADVFNRLGQATKAAGASAKCGIRVSIDAYHRLAPRPVTDVHYANIIYAYASLAEGIHSRVILSFRGLMRERDQTETYLASISDGEINRIDEWNSELLIPGSPLRARITYNIMRFSGAAAANQIEKLPEDISMMEYFTRYARQPSLRLSQSINDASRGRYPRNSGAAITVESDGRIHIFTASPPDRYAQLGWRFEEIQAFFSADPLTQWLYNFGPLPLIDLMRIIAPQRVAAALATEDVTALVPMLLSDRAERTVARLCAVKALHDSGLALELGPFYLRHQELANEIVVLSKKKVTH